MGRVPEVGDTVASHGLEFTVIEMDGSRIVRLRVDPIAQRAL
jgi:CBS domain containing-hemolysin-like protein